MFLRRQPSWNTAFWLFIQLWEEYHKKLIYIQHAVYFINLLMSRKDDVSDAETRKTKFFFCASHASHFK